MSYKIIVDSCCDLTASQMKNGPFLRVPLTITVGGETVVDDDTFDQTHLLMLIQEDPRPPKTACPSPAAWMAAFDAAQADDIYVVTLSAMLSGSHNSAEQAKALWLEDHPGVNIRVCNSRSAVSGEVQVAMKLDELAGSGLSFQEVCDGIDQYISSMTTLFVLENLDHLRKNGRLSGPLALAVSALRVKLVCAGTREGEIKRVGQGLTIRQCLSRLVSMIAADPTHRGKRAVINHCNNADRALYVRNELKKHCAFGDILITEAHGITTVYANDGGVVVAY